MKRRALSVLDVRQSLAQQCPIRDNYRVTEFRSGRLFSTSNDDMLTFFQVSVGSGLPFGGPHSRRAVSPAATRVSCGSTRKSSRKTVTK